MPSIKAEIEHLDINVSLSDNFCLNHSDVYEVRFILQNETLILNFWYREQYIVIVNNLTLGYLLIHYA